MREDIKDYRGLFMGIEEQVPLKDGGFITGINFDNAATTPPFKKVIKNIVDFSPWYSSIHRGKGYKSRICDEFYDKARHTILKFLNGSVNKYNVIFVKNTTEGINKLAYRLIDCKEGIVLTTRMEHHSNDLPWRDKCRVEYVEVDKQGRLSVEDLINKLRENRGNIKLVTLTGASNVTGYVNDVNLLACICHSYGCRIMVDGAQLVPHKKINLNGTGEYDYIDYLVFSSHKMYAPFGIGVIIVPKDCFQKGDPEHKGGGTVKYVTDNQVIWDDPPYKEEAGTPNFMGIVALLSAIRELNIITMENVNLMEEELTSYLIKGLSSIKEVDIYGDYVNIGDKLGITTFNVTDISHSELAETLSGNYGIAVRNGCFCAHPYVQRLLKLRDEDIEQYIHNPSYEKPGMVRISFGLYNNKNEVDYFLNALEQIISCRSKKIFY